ncbi:GNAT family N-acetyltransferase [Neiella marina]|uniref:GNAT family N-acetyltransferase n=1 Tax=Neiella holothuriorum TaxID=2870530 RepID=A0ABS7EDV3_9GAMM|nr:GNAT family N-acetyltransferase [Neiella holothuriorum]MBW8190440.1 GNAT family N-acetyltransferase [Neiella holothuriorum]
MNSSFKYYFVKFCQLNSHRLMACLQLRQDVFMLEQNSLYRDLDGLDQTAWHYIIEENNQPIAYARLIPPHVPANNNVSTIQDHDVHIGRVVIAERYRGKGIARKLMNDLIAESRNLFPNNAIAISAQAHLTGFYESLGFECVGEIYDDGGVDHIDMINTTDSLL